MNKLLPQFLEKPDISDKPDSFEHNANMSVLSVRPQDILCKNLGNMSETGPDISDKFGSNMNMSGLSGSPQGLSEENLGNMSKIEPDISDRFDSTMNMLSLSGRPQGHLEENLGNMTKTGPDISDRFGSNVNISGLSDSPRDTFDKDSLRYGFEESLAIVEHDGYQTSIQAQRIAYLDMFISLLSNLAEDDPHKDWLNDKIQSALAVLEAQRFSTMN